VYRAQRTKRGGEVKRLTVALLASLVVLAAAPAWAKEIKEVNVCGKSDCMRLTGRKAMVFFDDDGMPTSPPKAGPFYTVEFVATDGKHETRWTVDYVPSAGVIRSDDDFGNDVWTTVNLSPAVEKVTAGLEPLPASKLIDAASKAGASGSSDATTTSKHVGGTAIADDAGAPWAAIAIVLFVVAALGVSTYFVLGRRWGRRGKPHPAGEALVP
jgi:hypothetical protein